VDVLEACKNESLEEFTADASSANHEDFGVVDLQVM
jgi:hypothetical protein